MIKEDLEKYFFQTFSSGQNPIIACSPGRINIIGEHTDYNEGFVLPAAIDKVAYFVVSSNEEDTINLLAYDLDEKCSVAINDIQPVSNVTWPNYILGVVAQFIERGANVKGFNALLTSDIPLGAGLSSSAAVCCATVFALNELFRTRFDEKTMIKMAQKAEHNFAGVNCGIMDQFASIMGKKDHLIKLDCRSLNYSYVPLHLQDHKILLINSNVKHSLSSSEYNIRREQCNQALDWIKEIHPQIHSLRDVTHQMLNDIVLPKNESIHVKARYVLEENDRLHAVCSALMNGDLIELGRMMYASHEGLRLHYRVSCEELDLLVDQTRQSGYSIGSRMMGGGFGGCTINIIREQNIKPLLDLLKPIYEKQTGLELTSYIVSIENGTKLVN